MIHTVTRWSSMGGIGVCGLGMLFSKTRIRRSLNSGRAGLPNRALLIIDMQNEYVDPSGLYPVPGIKDIVVPINRLIMDSGPWAVIAFTQDWHEKDNGFGCVAGTNGIKILPGLIRPPGHVTVRKMSQDVFGHRFGSPKLLPVQISPTFSHELFSDFLHNQSVEEVVICGVIFNYCVRRSALSASKEGFSTTVVQEATRSVPPRKSERYALTESETMAEFENNGVRVVTSAHDL